MVQLKTLYTDYSNALPASDRQAILLGLWLLFLLTENRIGDFHAELEQLARTIPNVFKSAEYRYIAFVVELEQAKMEGRYTRLWQAPAQVPAECYVPLTKKLIETARQDIANSMEVAYDRVHLKTAISLLGLSSTEELQPWISERGWRVEADYVVMRKNAAPPQVDAHALIAESLRYANELERII